MKILDFLMRFFRVGSTKKKTKSNGDIILGSKKVTITKNYYNFPKGE